MKPFCSEKPLALIYLCFCICIAAGAPARSDPLPTGPDFTLPFLRESGRLTLTEVLPRKEFTVLLFFDSRCVECMDKIAQLGDLPYELEDAGFSVQVLGINTDSKSLGRIRSFVKGERIAFPVLSDTMGRTPELYNCAAYSFSYFLLDKKGRLRDHHLDQAPDIRDRIFAGIRRALDEKARGQDDASR